MGKIIVVGLGPGAQEHISMETLAAMRNADKVILRTSVHPSAAALSGHGINYTSLDNCYDLHDFNKVYQAIVETLLAESEKQDIVYAVPGSPQVAEKTVVLLRQQAKNKGVQVKMLPALSFLDVFFSSLGVDPVDGLTIVDALVPTQLSAAGDLPLLITQVYDKHIASEVKLSLMEKYADETMIFFLRNLGMKDEEIKEICLYELDRQENIDHLTSVYLPKPCSAMNITPLVDTLAQLRAPGGCPWDREQTAASLRQYLVEEVYEVIDAIDNENTKELCDELGDLLLQIVFHARIAEENGSFAMQDVVTNVVEKMYRRHPHVFGTIQVSDSAEVIKNWEEIKKTEYTERKNILDGIPKGLPALAASYKLQGKAAKVGFDWPDAKGVWDKLAEEIAELKEAVAHNDGQEIEHEFGDMLFAMANLGKHLGSQPEIALNKANGRFKKRFSYVEECVINSKKPWQDFSLAELDEFWSEAKTVVG